MAFSSTHCLQAVRPRTLVPPWLSVRGSLLVPASWSYPSAVHSMAASFFTACKTERDSSKISTTVLDALITYVECILSPWIHSLSLEISHRSHPYSKRWSHKGMNTRPWGHFESLSAALKKLFLISPINFHPCHMRNVIQPKTQRDLYADFCNSFSVELSLLCNSALKS